MDWVGLIILGLSVCFLILGVGAAIQENWLPAIVFVAIGLVIYQIASSLV